MSVTELISSVQFVVDEAGNKKAVLDWQAWEELLSLLEDLEDVRELAYLRQSDDEEVISWEQAKAELRTEGIDV